MTEPTWRVMRRDDNGNAYVVRGDLTRDAAEALRDELERRAHKQTYWVERDPLVELDVT